MEEQVKLVAMLYEGHGGPGGKAYRGHDPWLKRDITVEAGTTVMVSEQMAKILDVKTGWKRGSMAPKAEKLKRKKAAKR